MRVMWAMRRRSLKFPTCGGSTRHGWGSSALGTGLEPVRAWLSTDPADSVRQEAAGAAL